MLAIAARKLGCREAVGVDVEYEALESAAENAERNGIVDGVDWVHGRSVVPGMDEYDAVVANILVFRGASRIMTCTPSMVATLAHSAPSMVATLALWRRAVSGIRPDQCAVLRRSVPPGVSRCLRDPRRQAHRTSAPGRELGLSGPVWS